MSFFQERYRSFFENIVATSISLPSSTHHEPEKVTEAAISLANDHFSIEKKDSHSRLVKRIAELGLLPTINSNTQNIFTNSDNQQTSVLSHQANLALIKDLEPTQLPKDFELDNISTSELLASVEQDLFLIKEISNVSHASLPAEIYSKTHLDVHERDDSSQELYLSDERDQMLLASTQQELYNKNALFSHMECLILGRSVAILSAYTSQILVDHSKAAYSENEYWEAQISSGASTAYFIIQSFPENTVRFIFNSFRYLYKATKHTSLQVYKEITKTLSHSRDQEGIGYWAGIFYRLVVTTLKKLWGSVSFGYLKDCFVYGADISYKILPDLGQAGFRAPRLLFGNLGVYHLTSQKIKSAISDLEMSINSSVYRLGMLCDLDVYSKPCVGTSDVLEATQLPFQSAQTVQMFNQVVSAVSVLNIATFNYSITSPVADLSDEISSVPSWDEKKLVLVNKLALARKRISELKSSLAFTVEKNRRPMLLTRAWIPTLMLGLASYYTSRIVIGYTESIKAYVYQLAGATLSYTQRYIIDPLKEAYNTIRYGGRIITVVSSASLESSIKALQMMSVNLLSSDQILSDQQIKEIQEQIEVGDISMVMERYAKEIKNPIKNALFGDLVPLILIQVQKANVDIQNALAALDKLLRSNELNFVFLAVMPAILILYGSAKLVAGVISTLSGGVDDEQAGIAFKYIMRDIDILLNQQLGIEESTKSMPSANLNSTDQRNNEISASIGITSTQKKYLFQGTLLYYTERLRQAALGIVEKNRGGLKSSGRFRNSLLLQSVGLYSYNTTEKARMQSVILTDIRDLENFNFSSQQRYNVLQRMYRTFGLN